MPLIRSLEACQRSCSAMPASGAYFCLTRCTGFLGSCEKTTVRGARTAILGRRSGRESWATWSTALGPRSLVRDPRACALRPAPDICRESCCALRPAPRARYISRCALRPAPEGRRRRHAVRGARSSRLGPRAEMSPAGVWPSSECVDSLDCQCLLFYWLRLTRPMSPASIAFCVSALFMPRKWFRYLPVVTL